MTIFHIIGALLPCVGALGAYTQFLSYRQFPGTYRRIYLKKITDAIRQARSDEELKQLRYLRKVYGLYLIFFGLVIAVVVLFFLSEKMTGH